MVGVAGFWTARLPSKAPPESLTGLSSVVGAIEGFGVGLGIKVLGLMFSLGFRIVVFEVVGVVGVFVLLALVLVFVCVYRSSTKEPPWNGVGLGGG